MSQYERRPYEGSLARGVRLVPRAGHADPLRPASRFLPELIKSQLSCQPAGPRFPARFGPRPRTRPATQRTPPCGPQKQPRRMVSTAWLGIIRLLCTHWHRVSFVQGKLRNDLTPRLGRGSPCGLEARGSASVAGPRPGSNFRGIPVNRQPWQDVISPLSREELTRAEEHIRCRLSGRVRDLRLLVRDQGLVLQGHAHTY